MHSGEFVYLDLLRHGETEGGARYRGTTDDPLNAAGWVQMWSAVKDGVHWQGIVTSSLRRCAEFARALARQRSIPLTFDERLAEMHFGAWEGRSTTELMLADPDALARFWDDPAAHAPPGAEPLARFATRVLVAWNDIVRDHPGRRVLLVTHGGVIRVILCHVLRRPVERLLELDVGHAALHRIRADIDAQGNIRAELVAEPSA
ncbi:MAG: alpha-ribazole phosphatase family protein [Sulfuricaulis sp.]